MTQPARHEEVHYCARCRAIIEEEAAEAADSAPREIASEPEAKKDRDSGVMPIVETGIETESEIETEQKIEAHVDDAPTESRMEVAPESLPQPITEAAPAAAIAIAPEHELRATPRRQVEVDVGIHSDSHFFAGLTGDVSRGGLFVATYAELEVGSKVTLDFELPNGHIVADGTVRWHRSARDHHSPGFGVQFERIAPEMLKLIERFCQARPPLYYDQADDDF